MPDHNPPPRFGLLSRDEPAKLSGFDFMRGVQDGLIGPGTAS